MSSLGPADGGVIESVEVVDRTDEFCDGAEDGVLLCVRVVLRVEVWFGLGCAEEELFKVFAVCWSMSDGSVVRWVEHVAFALVEKHNDVALEAFGYVADKASYSAESVEVVTEFSGMADDR